MTRILPLLFAAFITAVAAQSDEWTLRMERATAFENTGDLRGAAAELRQAAKVAEQSVAPTLKLPLALNRLGIDYELLGMYSDSAAVYRRVLAAVAALKGEESGDYAVALGNLASVTFRLGPSELAESIARRAMSIHSKLNPSSTAMAVARATLAQLLIDQGRWREAVPLVESDVAFFAGASVRDPMHFGMALNNLAVVRNLQDRHAEALQLAERAVSELEKGPAGVDAPALVETLNNLGTTYANVGNLPAADRVFARATALAEAKHRTSAPVYVQLLANYAEVLRLKGEKREAARMKDRAREAALERNRINGVGMTVTAMSLRDQR